MTEQINKAPGGATHQYTTTDWYREAEDGLYFWDGKWSKSHFSSVAEMVKIRVMGIVEAIPALPAKPAEDDLTWLARNVHEWPEIITGGTFGPCVSIPALAKLVDGKLQWLTATPAAELASTKEQWLARRAELENKPDWKDAPEWAVWLGQCAGGDWEWYEDDGEHTPYALPGGNYWIHNMRGQVSGHKGEVLGHWCGTLEHRPVTKEPE